MRINEKTLRAYVRSLLVEQEEEEMGLEDEEGEDPESDGLDNDDDGETDEEGETAEEQGEEEEEAALEDEGEDVANKSQAVEELKAFIENGIPQIPNAQLDALMDQFKILAQQAAEGKLAAKEEEIQKDVGQNVGDDEVEASAAEAEGAEDKGK
jgi:hypothetical protein